MIQGVAKTVCRRQASETGVLDRRPMAPRGSASRGFFTVPHCPTSAAGETPSPGLPTQSRGFFRMPVAAPGGVQMAPTTGGRLRIDRRLADHARRLALPEPPQEVRRGRHSSRLSSPLGSGGIAAYLAERTACRSSRSHGALDLWAAVAFSGASSATGDPWQGLPSRGRRTLL